MTGAEGAASVSAQARATSRNLSAVAVLGGFQYPLLALSAMLIPRVMGPESYGQYALLLSIAAVVLPLLDLGVTEIFGRFVPELESRGDTARVRALFTRFLAIKLALDTLACGLLIAGFRLAYGSSFGLDYAFALAAIVLVMDLGALPHALAFGMNRMARYALREPLRRGLGLLTLLVFFHFFGLLGALLATAVVEGLLAMLYFWWARERISLHDWRVDWRFAAPYLAFGFLFYVSSGIAGAWQRIGNSLIQYFTGRPAEVAVFDLANQIFLIGLRLPLTLVLSLVPAFTALLFAQQQDKLGVWSALTLKYSLIACVLAFGAALLTGAELLPIAIGPQYAAVHPNVVVLMSGMFPMVVAQFALVLSLVYREPAKYFRALCIAFASFLVAAVILIPRFGALGCSAATTLSCAVFAIAAATCFRDRWPAGRLDLGKALGLGLLVVPFWWLRRGLAWNLGLTVAFAASYGIALFWASVLKPEELKQLRSALRSES